MSFDNVMVELLASLAEAVFLHLTTSARTVLSFAGLLITESKDQALTQLELLAASVIAVLCGLFISRVVRPLLEVVLALPPPKVVVEPTEVRNKTSWSIHFVGDHNFD